MDSARTVYVTDTAKNRVCYLAVGSNKQIEVPFTGLNAPTGLVVAQDGTIYVADGGNNRVLVIGPWPKQQQTKVPFVGLSDPGGVTVDSEGAVYVTDSVDNRVLKLPAGTRASKSSCRSPASTIRGAWQSTTTARSTSQATTTRLSAPQKSRRSTAGLSATDGRGTAASLSPAARFCADYGDAGKVDNGAAPCADFLRAQF